jgi:hypothetical protein
MTRVRFDGDSDSLLDTFSVSSGCMGVGASETIYSMDGTEVVINASFDS